MSKERVLLTEGVAMDRLLRCGAKIKGMTIETSKPVGLKMLSAIDRLKRDKFVWVRREPKNKSQEGNE